jgi:hypothetical protein
MNQDMDLIIKIKKQDKINEEELFGKLKEFLGKNKGEYPQVSLVSMIIDSFETGSSIFKLKKELKVSQIQTNFIEA